VDKQVLPSRAGGATSRRITVQANYFNQFLGTNLPLAEVEASLESLDCQIEGQASGEWQVTPPSFRLDLSSREELAEEVARVVGYDRIPSTIPVLSSPPRPAMADPGRARLGLIDRAKDLLAQAGLNEALNFSFTSRQWLKEFGLSTGCRS